METHCQYVEFLLLGGDVPLQRLRLFVEDKLDVLQGLLFLFLPQSSVYGQHPLLHALGLHGAHKVPQLLQQLRVPLKVIVVELHPVPQHVEYSARMAFGKGQQESVAVHHTTHYHSNIYEDIYYNYSEQRILPIGP